MDKTDLEIKLEYINMVLKGMLDSFEDLDPEQQAVLAKKINKLAKELHGWDF